ncbi:hypothetical protein [Klebsiella phage phiKp_22]|nr:hypothetical protein [Klebsiella phage phiKp_22]
MKTTILTTNDTMKVFLNYGRPHKGRRWYLEAVCRETGRRENAKFSARPTRKQVHRFMSWAGETLRLSLYWAEI